MKFVRIKKGPFKGRLAQVLKRDGDELTVKIEGEDKPQKIKVDWVKVLTFLSNLLSIIISFIKK